MHVIYEEFKNLIEFVGITEKYTDLKGTKKDLYDKLFMYTHRKNSMLANGLNFDGTIPKRGEKATAMTRFYLTLTSHLTSNRFPELYIDYTDDDFVRYFEIHAYVANFYKEDIFPELLNNT